jgi:hypothetical protein
VLPLATALVGALLHRQRPSAGFWACAFAGSALVIAYAVLRSGQSVRLHFADALLLAAVACAAVGYGYGARLSQRMRAEHVICWALVIAWPLTLPLAWWTRPATALPASAWWASATSPCSRCGSASSPGTAVSPGRHGAREPGATGAAFPQHAVRRPAARRAADLVTLGFALAVIATVFLGRRMPVRAATRAASPTLSPAMEPR